MAMPTPPLLALFISFAFLIFHTFAAPASPHAVTSRHSRASNKAFDGPQVVTTTQTVAVSGGTITEICQVELVPVDFGGLNLVQEIRNCKDTFNADGSSTTLDSTTTTTTADSTTTTDTTDTSASDSTTTTDNGSTTTTSSDAANTGSSDASANTSSSDASATTASPVNVTGIVASTTSSSTTSSESTTTTSSSTTDSGAISVPTSSDSATTSANTSASVSSDSTASATTSANSSAATGDSGASAISVVGQSSVPATPTAASDVASSSAAAASRAGDAAAATSSAFQLPGKKLEVLPIGLGVFAGISVIALIVVGLVTYERTKYRRAFRQRRQLAAQGAEVGYGGMSERR